MAIARETAAKLLFYSNRTCCVCREPQRPLQIHHIDGDCKNHDFENLAVLCLECHTETQKKGGFYRKLDAAQVRLYRNEWLNIIGRSRMADPEAPDLGATFGITEASRERVVEILMTNRQYEVLARHYHLLGEHQLRDKFVELALAQPGVSLGTEITLRLRQKRLHEVDPVRVQAFLESPQSLHGTLEVVQIYRALGRDTEALITYCDAIVQMMQAGDRFLAALLLRGLEMEDFASAFFQAEFRDSRAKGLLWKQMRCLQELHWEKELQQLMAEQRKDIERSGNPLLRFELYKTLREHDRLNEAYVGLYETAAQTFTGVAQEEQLAV